jgi:patatin-like phospholipase
MYDWSKHKIGIVLSGGGAKGAYEIGCWDALAKAGLTFSAISGTSIGGINGYLMSVVDVKKAKSIWIEMGRSSPLPISIFRLFLFFLERLGLSIVMALEIFVIVPGVTLVALIVTLVVVTPCYFLARELLAPLTALAPAMFPVMLIGLARALRNTHFTKVTRVGVQYSLRETRRHTRYLVPVEFAVLFGLILTLAPAVMLAFSIIGSGRSWMWSLLVVTTLALNLLGILLSSDAGFSSPGEISLFSTEDLEAMLVRHGTRDENMPLHPRLYLARLREQVISIPGAVPRWVRDAAREFVPNKRWEELTPQDLAAYRQGLDASGLNRYYLNSIATVLGLEYVELTGKPVLEAADSVLSTSAIADALGRVQQRLSGIAEQDLILRAMSAQFYDPGLVDNTPIAPLLDAAECDLIVVIFLDYAIRDAREYLAGQLENINSHLRLLNPDLDGETYEALAEVRMLNPARDCRARLDRVKLLPLIPSQPLGRGPIGFIKETLWFRESRIRELMRLGFQDTERALKRFVETESH